jgi:diacylglycerol kinase family enzyme
MPSALIIANPAASGFRSADLRGVAGILVGAYTVEAAWPASAEHAHQLASEAVDAGTDVVVAMGGDGIIHHVGQALVGRASALGVVPVGTANVLARQLGIPRRPSAAARLLVGEHRVADERVVEVKATGPHRDLERYVFFSLGAGADAEVVQEAEKDPFRKRGLGPYHYAATAMSLVRRGLGRRRLDLEVSAGAWHTGAIGVMAQFRDSYTYFGGRPLRVLPEAPDPITLLIVKELRIRRTLAMLRASAGRLGLDRVNGFEAWRRVDGFGVTSARPFVVQADGEILGNFDRISARIAETAVSVIVPAQS